MGGWLLSRRDRLIVAWHEYVFSAVSAARRALQFGHLIRAPKGLYDSAWGFNPRNPTLPRRTLKGCKVDWPKNRAKERNCPISWREHQCTNIVSVWRIETGRFERGSLAPLQHLQPGRAGCFSRGRNGVAPCEGASPGWMVPGVETPG
jgi:hypothetical protein